MMAATSAVLTAPVAELKSAGLAGAYPSAFVTPCNVGGGLLPYCTTTYVLNPLWITFVKSQTAVPESYTSITTSAPVFTFRTAYQPKLK